MKRKFQLTQWQLLTFGYLTVILLGSILLALPFATKEGNTTYLNALFVSTSATCVTGLVPYDTGTHWTLFGQIMILLLIQTGGLGFMTFVSVSITLFGKKMGLHGRQALMVSAGESTFSGLKNLIKRIALGSFAVEALGTALLSIRFCQDFGFGEGLYYSLWHSISAFCNAGFDLMGSKYGQFSSLSAYSTDPLVVLTICFLIIIGGAGFCVWSDIWNCKFRWKKYRLHTKIVVSVSLSLLIFGTALFLLFERNNAECASMNFGGKLLVALFNATTTRTAGFNTVDFGGFSGSGYMLALILMFIGGASGSTAGGVKVNTFAVIVMGIWASFRGNKDINISNRRVNPILVAQALAVFVSCLFLTIISTMIIGAIETDVPLVAVLFECVSALGTVGLSMSLTPLLSVASRIIIILLMFAGRVGILTLALAFGENRSTANIRLPVDDTVLIG